MTIAGSWYDAATLADQRRSQAWYHKIVMGTYQMSVAYRDDSYTGSWSTLQDSIWNWGTDISFYWGDITLDEQRVYP